MLSRLNIWSNKASDEAGKPIRANMGQPNNMYYHEELKRWVQPGQEEAVRKEQEAQSAPPPPMAAADLPSAVPGGPADLSSRYPTPCYAQSYVRPPMHRRVQSSLGGVPKQPTPILKPMPDDFPAADISDSPPGLAIVSPAEPKQHHTKSLPPTPYGGVPRSKDAEITDMMPLASPPEPVRGMVDMSRRPPPMGAEREPTFAPQIPSKPSSTMTGPMPPKAALRPPPVTHSNVPPPPTLMPTMLGGTSNVPTRPPTLSGPPPHPSVVLGGQPHIHGETKNVSPVLPPRVSGPPPPPRETMGQRDLPPPRDSIQQRDLPPSRDHTVMPLRESPPPPRETVPPREVVMLKDDDSDSLQLSPPLEPIGHPSLMLGDEEKPRESALPPRPRRPPLPSHRDSAGHEAPSETVVRRGSRRLVSVDGSNRLGASESILSRRANSARRIPTTEGPSSPLTRAGAAAESALSEWFAYKSRVEAARSVAGTPVGQSRRDTITEGFGLETSTTRPSFFKITEAVDPVLPQTDARVEQSLEDLAIVAKAALRDAHGFPQASRREAKKAIDLVLAKFPDRIPLSQTLRSLGDILDSDNQPDTKESDSSLTVERVKAIHAEPMALLLGCQQRIQAAQEAFEFNPSFTLDRNSVTEKSLRQVNEKVQQAITCVVSMRRELQLLVSGFSGALEKYRNEILMLNDQLDADALEKNEIRSMMDEERKRWQDERSQSLFQRSHIMKENQHLTKELAQKNEALSQQQRSLEVAESSIHELKLKVHQTDELRRQIEGLERELDKQKQLLVRREREQETREQYRKQFEQETEQWRQRSLKAEAELLEQQDIVARLQLENQDSNEVQSDLQQALNTANAKMTSLKADLLQAQRELSAAQRSHTMNESMLSSLQDEIDQLQKSQELSKQREAAAHSEIARLRAALEASEKKNRGQEQISEAQSATLARLQLAEAQVASLECSLAAAQEDAERAQSDVRVMAERVRSAEERVMAAESDLQTASQRLMIAEDKARTAERDSQVFVGDTDETKQALQNVFDSIQRRFELMTTYSERLAARVAPLLQLLSDNENLVSHTTQAASCAKIEDLLVHLS